MTLCLDSFSCIGQGGESFGKMPKGPSQTPALEESIGWGGYLPANYIPPSASIVQFGIAAHVMSYHGTISASQQQFLWKRAVGANIFLLRKCTTNYFCIKSFSQNIFSSRSIFSIYQTCPKFEREIILRCVCV